MANKGMFFGSLIGSPAPKIGYLDINLRASGSDM